MTSELKTHEIATLLKARGKQWLQADTKRAVFDHSETMVCVERLLLIVTT